MKFFASCAKGLEYLLVDEMISLGCAHATATMAGAHVQGTLQDAQRAVMWSRLASRVVWPIAEYDCLDTEALYAGAMTVPWQQHLNAQLSFAVDAHVSGTAITHARYAAQRVKDAVVDTIRTQTSERPNVDLETPDVRLNLVVRKDRAILSIDLGGALHRRGWRQAQGEAPLKENLAAAVLMRGRWPQRYAEGGGLLDPMCGSGTLLIEGALMAADVAPGLLRYGEALPSHWLGFDSVQWNALRLEAQTRARAGRGALRLAFLGSDNDPHAIRAARENATAAGIRDIIEFRTCEITEMAVQGSPALGADTGLVVCNPPYDARLAADPALYRALGNALRRVAPNWRASVLCGDAMLAKSTGLRANKTYQLYNGAIECLLIVCDPIAPERASAELPVLSEGAQMVANRLRKNVKKFKHWLKKEGITCYRVYDADLPEYSAAIDVYFGGSDTDPWLHVQEYAAPAEIPEEFTQRRLKELLAAVRDVFAVPQERIALKTRRRGKGGSKYSRNETAVRGEFLEVQEGAAKFRVNLFDYLDTGLFLDHRPLRLRIAEEAEDTRFLNLFGYTGTASVHAALGRARQTTTVDLSAPYLQWCTSNFQLNGITGSKHRLVQADALAWLAAETNQYDLIFCDPPTFSNSARAEDFDVQQQHVLLLELAMDRLAPDGVLYFSNNSRRFRIDSPAIETFADCKDISASTIPVDFARNPRIHRTWRLRHLR